MKNCSVVTFDLLSTVNDRGVTCYKIDEASIEESHLGFEK